MRRALALFAAALMLFCFPFPYVQAAEPVELVSVSGTVRDPGGAPLQGVTVKAINTTSGAIFSSLTNETGGYELEVPLGTYNITATLVNYTANTSYAYVNLGAISTGPYDFTMTEVLGKIVGFITDNDGPVYNVIVRLSNEERNYTTTSTQLFGRYEINGIQPGIYVLYAEKRGYNRFSYPLPVEVERGKVLEIDMTLEAQPARVFGVVTAENGRPIGDVRVTLKASDGSLNTFTDTGPDGNYSIGKLSAGTYTMTFEKEGYETVTKSFDFGPYEEKMVDITLVREQAEGVTVLFGYDLAHSLMIIGFIVGLVIVLLGVLVNVRGQKKPELLAQIERKEKDEGD
ncbi:MAG: carboxypeptidase regulatory-like domain-containing protein [Methanomassiliicoccales archaeon]|nr:MAG: carboxypeptidase regulatory-like domain-containing protein [Methanomassiliicoccales archaeon]